MRSAKLQILMLGNSFTSANGLPQLLAEKTGARVAAHTRGGARLAEQLNSKTKLGAKTQAALASIPWDYVLLQEMSHGPITARERFLDSAAQLCTAIRQNGAVPIFFSTWPYQKGCAKLSAKGWDYDEMADALFSAYHQAARENHAPLAEVGQLFYALSPSQNLYAADGIHPNLAGSRLASRVLAEVILQQEEQHHDP